MLLANQVDNRFNFSGRPTVNNPNTGNGFKDYLIKETKMSNNSTPSLKRNELSPEHALSTGSSQNRNGRVYIGKISDQIPTVSELIYVSPYKKKCWQILDRDVNASKLFRRIRPGTDIYLDTRTSEIIWGGKIRCSVKNLDSTKTDSIKTDSIKTDSINESKLQFKSADLLKSKLSLHELQPLTQLKEGLQSFPVKEGLQSSSVKEGLQSSSVPDLNHVVSKFIGRGYEQMDCYEMVVEGLKNLGIKYQGSNGLRQHLIDKAVGSGLPRNRYLNGEGLVSATGQDAYHKKFFRIKDSDVQAEATMHEMEKVLKEGQILSFSTRTRGHTGVISKKDNTWTFINSGVMDNNIAGKNGLKAVGEEILSRELQNWFKLAASKNEGLQITLGNIDMTKFAMYRNSDFSRPTFNIPG